MIKVVYTIEFEKQLLPCVHILLWLERENTTITPVEIDSIALIEFLDKETDPIVYASVSSFIMHGPCGYKHHVWWRKSARNFIPSSLELQQL